MKLDAIVAPKRARRTVITKALLNAAGIHNSHNVCHEGGGSVYIFYKPRGLGRSYRSPKWAVDGIGFHVDSTAEWIDHGCKVFTCNRDTREQRLADAKAWASEKYGISEWARDPFGGWQDAVVLERVRALLGERSDA